MMRLVVVVALLAASVPSARAEPDKPWAAGVSEAEQNQALAIYREGNKQFETSQYARAVVHYREALQHWDHPAIHFNMAVALVNLDQPLEAYDHLVQAMKYGEAPLGADNWAQAQTYQKLLERQLAHLRVRCDTDGAEVTLDGKALLHGKGETTKLLLAGEHQIVASKPGYATETKSVVLVGGKELVQVVALHPIAVKARLVRRWNASVPWIVLGTGAATAAAGGALEWLSHRDYQSFDQTAAKVCPCPPGKIDTSTRSRARVENIAGVSLLAAGGAVAAAGILGVYLNQPRAIAEHAPVITPSVGPAGAHVTATWTW